MGIVTISLATGGMTGDLFILYAHQVLGIGAHRVGWALGLTILGSPIQLLAVPLESRLGKRRLMQLGYLLLIIGFVPLLLFTGGFPLESHSWICEPNYIAYLF